MLDFLRDRQFYKLGCPMSLPCFDYHYIYPTACPSYSATALTQYSFARKGIYQHHLFSLLCSSNILASLLPFKKDITFEIEHLKYSIEWYSYSHTGSVHLLKFFVLNLFYYYKLLTLHLKDVFCSLARITSLLRI